MSSYTITLNGTRSELSAEFYPPIELDSGVEYVCGLVDFQSYMSIPNVTSKNNKLSYKDQIEVQLVSGNYTNRSLIERLRIQLPKRHLNNNNISKLETDFINQVLMHKATTYEGGLPYFTVNNDINITINYTDVIELPMGSYEIVDIAKKVNELLGNVLEDFKFSIKVDKNTQKCIIETTHILYFDKEDSIGSILGFSNNRVIKPDTLYTSDFMIKISRVNVIKIECNIVEGSYSNNNPGHTIHEFYPTVETGYKIVEVPRNVIYLPIRVRSIHDIRVRIVDQYNELIDFRSELITLRVHIKRI